MAHICIRSADPGPSSGAIAVVEVVVRREDRVVADDLWDMRDAVDVLAEILPGILSACLRWIVYCSSMKSSEEFVGQ